MKKEVETALFDQFKSINDFLSQAGINPILYGSLGVSVYLGEFKEIGDIDLLVQDEWVNDKWNELVTLMQSHQFFLTDEHEHEFQNDTGTKVAFATQHILTRDNICDPLTDPVTVNRNNIAVITLSVDDFIKAYLFSSQDGYRLEKREKNDLMIVELLRELKR